MMEETYIDLMLNRGVAGVLIVFIAFLMALLKVVFDMYTVTNKEKNELSKQVISVILKYEHQLEEDKKENDRINTKLDAIQQTINGGHR